jgi:hypothetical protein
LQWELLLALARTRGLGAVNAGRIYGKSEKAKDFGALKKLKKS